MENSNQEIANTHPAEQAEDGASQPIQPQEDSKEEFSSSVKDQESSESGKISEETVKQIQEKNHTQYNYICKLEKDLEYWKKKCLDLTIEHQSAEFDLKRVKRVKGSNSKENKQLKDALTQLHAKYLERETEANDFKAQVDDLKSQNAKLTEELEAEQAKNQKPGDPEQDLMIRFMALPDLNAMGRVCQNMQFQMNQKYYNMMMAQQKDGQATGQSEYFSKIFLKQA